MYAGERHELSFEGHRGRGPSIVVSAPGALGGRASTLVLDPGRGSEAECLETGRGLLGRTGQGDVAEEGGSVRSEGLDVSLLCEVEIEPPTRGVLHLFPQAQ